MSSLAALALALAASLLAGCDQKKEPPPAPAPTSAPTSAPTAAPSAGAPAPAPAPAPPPAQASTPAAGEPAGPVVSAADAIRKLTELADKACACADRACVTAVYTAFQDENKRLASRLRDRPTGDEAAAMQAQAMRFSGCLQRLK